MFFPPLANDPRPFAKGAKGAKGRREEIEEIGENVQLSTFNVQRSKVDSEETVQGGGGGRLSTPVPCLPGFNVQRSTFKGRGGEGTIREGGEFCNR
jgi:hypothetical protein